MVEGTGIELDRLRQIGWNSWNPIGLDEAWKDAGGLDEYDPYLLHVVDMLASGASQADASAYLIAIASEHMGLSSFDPKAAHRTVADIAFHMNSVMR